MVFMCEPSMECNAIWSKLVAEAQRRVFNTLWNVYSFFVTNANVDNYDPDDRTDINDRSDLDKWIISRLQSVIKNVDEAYDKIMFHVVTKELDYFIVEELSNWYVRRSRRRFYGSEMTLDKKSSYDTIFEVLTSIARLIAPLTPYFAEEIYQNLEKNLDSNGLMSIHMQILPEPNDKLILLELEEKMSLLLSITNAARTARAESGIKARQPLKSLIIAFNDGFSKLP